jgi:hypothetical protein
MSCILRWTAYSDEWSAVIRLVISGADVSMPSDGERYRALSSAAESARSTITRISPKRDVLA